MNKQTYEALKEVVKKTRSLLNQKYGHRKRLSREGVWEKATLIRDIKTVEDWIDEVAKEYTEN